MTCINGVNLLKRRLKKRSGWWGNIPRILSERPELPDFLRNEERSKLLTKWLITPRAARPSSAIDVARRCCARRWSGSTTNSCMLSEFDRPLVHHLFRGPGPVLVFGQSVKPTQITKASRSSAWRTFGPRFLLVSTPQVLSNIHRSKITPILKMKQP
jgi:hypothetical protein